MVGVGMLFTMNCLSAEEHGQGRARYRKTSDEINMCLNSYHAVRVLTDVLEKMASPSATNSPTHPVGWSYMRAERAV